MDISIALLTTHALGRLAALYNGINTYNMDQSFKYKGRKRGEAGFKNKTSHIIYKISI